MLFRKFVPIRRSRGSSIPSWCMLVCGAIVVALGSASDALAQRTDLRVMSFNIRVDTETGANRWDVRKDLVVDVIDDYNADIIGMQEDESHQGTFVRTELSPRYTRFGRSVNANANGGGEYNSILYRTSRFTQVRSGTFWLSTTPNTAGSQSWGAQFPRTVNWLELADNNNPGFNFVVMNTHWEHASNGATARLNSATLMRQRMSTIAPNLPIIFTGDFNADQGGAAYQRMTGRDDFDDERFLIDTYRNRHPEDSGTVGTAHPWNGIAGDGRIDWILHTENDFTTVSAEIIRSNNNGRYPSDHFPISATLQPIIVPEPTTGAVLLIAGACAMLARRRSNA